MRQDELDLIEPSSPPQVLHRPCPALAGISKPVREDHRCCVLARRRKAERATISAGHAGWQLGGQSRLAARIRCNGSARRLCAEP
jgi:hypothetical protein